MFQFNHSSRYQTFFTEPLSQFWNRQNLQYIPVQPQEFYLADLKNRKLNLKILELERNYILKSNYDILIDIHNSHIEMIVGEAGRKGIRVRKDGTQIEFYGEVVKWFEKIKLYCIQSDFHKKYKVVNEISNGHNSKVFLVQNNQGFDKAAKVYEKSQLKSERDQIQLLKEIDILRQVKHPNITVLEEIYETPLEIILIFTFIEGGDLQKYMKKRGKALSESIAKRLLNNLGNAIKYLHSQKIMHRDIKTANIMINKENQIVLTDFGMADYIKHNGNYNYQRCGTAGFVAPEILRREFYNQKVDIYSLGVVLYILITGHHPFYGKTYQDTLNQNEEGIIDLKIEATNEAIDLLQHMLEPDPTKRLNIEQVLEHRWMNAFEIKKYSTQRYITIGSPKTKNQQGSPTSFRIVSQLTKQQRGSFLKEILPNSLSPQKCYSSQYRSRKVIKRQEFQNQTFYPYCD